MIHSEDTEAGLGKYRFLLAVLALPLVAHCVWMALRNRDARYLRQRLGRSMQGSAGPRPVWVHAASVGEVHAAAPLVTAWKRRNPEIPVLITTSTPSGGQIVAQRLPGNDHVYLPIDWRGAVGRFLDAHRPICGLIVETELWPNLYGECSARDIPLLIVNGRLSARTLGAPKWLRRLYHHCLKHVTAVLARSERDKAAFISLGAPAEKCHTVGNIKFAAADTVGHSPPPNLGRDYVLAASTREGEEKLVLKAWQSRDRDGRMLIIAPRHPKRIGEILADISPLTDHIAVRSRGDRITGQTEVYVADTFGELAGFMAGADLVFMGGSLVPKGGHNIVEPAALGKAIVFGPHMDNFMDEAELMIQRHAALQVRSSAELRGAFDHLLGTADERTLLGENARCLVAERKDMAERYLDATERYCAPSA